MSLENMDTLQIALLLWILMAYFHILSSFAGEVAVEEVSGWSHTAIYWNVGYYRLVKKLIN